MPDGCPPNAQQMQRLLGCSEQEWCIVEGELYGMAIADKSSDGRMICRRMVREAEEQRALSLHGRKAAKARWGDARPMPADAFRESESPRVRETKRPRNRETEKEVPPAPSADGLALAETAYDLITRNHPNLPSLKDRKRRVAAWAKDVDRFLRKSGKTAEECRAFLTWLAQDRESKAGSRWIGWWQPFQGIGILSKDAAWAAYAGRKRAGRSRYDDVK